MLDAARFLNELRQATSWESARRGLHLLLTNLTDQINSGFQQAGIQTIGKVQPPAAIQSLSVVASNGTVHAVLTHNSPINKQINYFVEAATDTSFLQPHVFDLRSSRTLFAPLPSTDNNSNPISWHFRSYAQYPGSDPSEHTYLGTQFVPTPVSVGGSAQFTPFPSTGSGTAAANGQSGGQGLGIDLERAPIGPKRNAALAA